MSFPNNTSDLLTTVYKGFVILTGFGTLLGGIAFLWFVVKSKGNKLLAQEWHDLAEVKAARIADLEKKVEGLESKLQRVCEENESLRRLNLDLQKEIAELMRRD